MNIMDTSINRLDGTPTTLRGLMRGNAALLVNVASRCGFTEQYGALEELHRRYTERGFTVVGLPCNQFAEEEPGSPEEIATFCSVNYGVTFPMTEKIRVNGKRRHLIYSTLVRARSIDGYTGDVRWNFEKFLIQADGQVVARFEPGVPPESVQISDRIETALCTGGSSV